MAQVSTSLTFKNMCSEYSSVSPLTEWERLALHHIIRHPLTVFFFFSFYRLYNLMTALIQGRIKRRQIFWIFLPTFKTITTNLYFVLFMILILLQFNFWFIFFFHNMECIYIYFLTDELVSVCLCGSMCMCDCMT